MALSTTNIHVNTTVTAPGFPTRLEQCIVNIYLTWTKTHSYNVKLVALRAVSFSQLQTLISIHFSLYPKCT